MTVEDWSCTRLLGSGGYGSEIEAPFLKWAWYSAGLPFRWRRGCGWLFIEDFALHLLLFVCVEPKHLVKEFFGNLFALALPSPCVISDVSPSAFLPETLRFRMVDQNTAPVPSELQASDITESEVLWLQNHF